MKKVIAILLLAMVCVGGICAADKDFRNMEKAPVLNVEGAYIFDLKPFHKKIEDNFAFHNMTNIKELEGDIYYVDPKTGEWCKNSADFELEGFNDRDIVEPNKKVKLERVPFFAFTVEPAGNYDFKLYPKNNDINIEIYKK